MRPPLALRSPVALAFAPADRFFMRVVPLAKGAPAAAQVELAVEGLAPFPLSQLYWGWCAAPDGARALVYAAHRRRFTAGETAEWERADAVVPDSLPLLAGAADEAERRQLAEKFAVRPGKPRATARRDRVTLELTGADGGVLATAIVPRTALDELDVRDRAGQGQRRRARRQREFVWRLLLAGAALLALSAVLEAAAFGFGFAAKARRAAVAERAALVQRLDTARSLTALIDELTHRRLRFFEMISAINAVRPASLRFVRTTSVGRNGLEIEASTSNAEDVDTYETALMVHVAVDHAEVRELRTRDGTTTFTLAVTFKPEALAASPVASRAAPAAPERKEGGT